MKITILTGSPRDNGTSNTLVNEFIKGALEKNHNIERYDTAKLKIHPCIGCDKCHMDGNCVFQDDMPKILNSILNSDLIVMASPVYYFGFSAQIKSVIDRFYSRNGKIQNKNLKVIFLITSWNDDDVVMKAIKNHISILIDYLNLNNINNLYATGYGYRGAFKEKEYMKIAYEMGKSI